MPRRTSRRRFNVFSLAFLDVMSCGFGAVVLIFLVINHRVDDDAKEVDRDMLAESRKLDFLITAGQDNLAELRERLEGALKRVADARRQLLATTEDAERRKKDADDLQARTIAQRESVEELKTDVETREREVKRLQAAEEASAGARARQVKGEGDRQYLTGLYVGGRHILIALDASASMLDSTIVQVLRRRNMPEERQLRAPKWQRAQRTVEWLAAQMPLDGNFQIAVFNAEARFLLPTSAWHEVLHPTAINDALESVGERGSRRRLQPRQPRRARGQHGAPAGQRVPGHRRPADPGRTPAAQPDRHRPPARAPLHRRREAPAEGHAGESHPAAARRRPAGVFGLLGAGGGNRRHLHVAVGGLAMIRRRDLEEIGLSFLDVICCGFGAIILLLMIVKIVEPIVLEEPEVDLEGIVAQKQDSLHAIRGQTRELTRQLSDEERQLALELAQLARVEQELRDVLSRFETTQEEAERQMQERSSYARAKQSLSDEMERLLGLDFTRADNTIGGITVDSEYVVFVIDTSGSMYSYAWNLVRRKVSETLAIYPRVKGIQVMNDMGDYMFSQYAGQWIPDSDAIRRNIVQRMGTWNVHSNSSPVEGIERAISVFYAEDKKISIYVFGDDFQGESIETVVDRVDRMNRVDDTGARRVRIHAVGFPVVLGTRTGDRFAALDARTHLPQRRHLRGAAVLRVAQGREAPPSRGLPRRAAVAILCRAGTREPDMIDFAGLNWWAILVAVAAAFALGGLWYGPLFGKAWLSALGKTEDDITPSAEPFIVSAVAALATCVVVAALMNGLGLTGLVHGLVFGFITGVGFIAAAMASDTAFCRWGWDLWAIQAGYRVAYSVLMGGIVGVWPA